MYMRISTQISVRIEREIHMWRDTYTYVDVGTARRVAAVVDDLLKPV